MWLSADPDVLLIDEPTRGIDVGAKAEIHTLLREIAGRGKAVITVSSELPEIMASCDRVLVMYEGKIVKEFVTIQPVFL
jgi:ABC-type sugar transport system ATPase subunit